MLILGHVKCRCNGGPGNFRPFACADVLFLLTAHSGCNHVCILTGLTPCLRPSFNAKQYRLPVGASFPLWVSANSTFAAETVSRVSVPSLLNWCIIYFAFFSGRSLSSRLGRSTVWKAAWNLKYISIRTSFKWRHFSIYYGQECTESVIWLVNCLFFSILMLVCFICFLELCHLLTLFLMHLFSLYLTATKSSAAQNMQFFSCAFPQ